MPWLDDAIAFTRTAHDIGLATRSDLGYLLGVLLKAKAEDSGDETAFLIDLLESATENVYLDRATRTLVDFKIRQWKEKNAELLCRS